MKVNHGIELAETQGRGALESYLGKQVKQAEENKRSKAVRSLVRDARFQQARMELLKMTEDHPKLDKLMPNYTVQKWADRGPTMSTDPTFLAEYSRIVEGLRRGGLPEN